MQAGYDAVVVSSEDTDVFVLFLSFSSSTDDSLFQKCGSTRLIDVKGVTTIGEDVGQALIGVYSLT